MLNFLFKKLNFLPKNIDGFSFPVRIIKSEKKNITLIIRDCSLVVRCPIILNEQQVYFLVKRKEEWIKKKILIQKKNLEILSKNSLTNNIVLFEGKKKKIKRENSKFFSIKLNGNQIIFSGPNTSNFFLFKLLTKWCKKIAKNKVLKKSILFSKKMNVTFNEINIKDYKSKWGLCMNWKKNIFINWRLIMAPNSVLDYVIIHELCHLIEPNHSKKFWLNLEKFKPDYKNDKEWLKNNGFLLFNDI